MELVEFLKQSKNSLVCLENLNRVTVVIGNEACDLDSAVSAIIYGYFLFNSYAKSGDIFVPVLDIDFKDYALRTEIRYILNRLGIFDESLIFRGEINLKVLHQKKKLSLILVDHNRLSDHYSGLESSVTEIIDHHELISNFNQTNVIFNVEKVGSCATLVAEKLLQSEVNVINDDVALLLYVTIILDTVNLSPAAKKTTAKDVSIISMLKNHLGSISNDEWFRCLTFAKSDVKDLTAEQVLRKDLKSVRSTSLCIGISSVPISMQDFFAKDDAKLAVRNFCSDNGYQVLVLMTIKIDSEIHREIAVYSSFDSYREQVEDAIERSTNPSFQLEYMNGGMENMTIFKQKNITASRKVLLPLLHKFLLGDDSPMSPTNVVTQNQSFSSLNINGSPDASSKMSDDMSLPFEDNLFSEISLIQPDSSKDVSMRVPSSSDPSSATQSQSSSILNSGAFTPYNSVVGSNLELDAYAVNILPSFNSQDMVDRIETKRGNLVGYAEGCSLIPNSVPFTPKNSFADSSMELYFRNNEIVNRFQAEELMQRVEKIKMGLECGYDGEQADVAVAPFENGDVRVVEGASVSDILNYQQQSWPQYSSGAQTGSTQSARIDPDVGGGDGDLWRRDIKDSDSEQQELIEEPDKQKSEEDVITNDQANEVDNNNTTVADDPGEEEKQDLSKSLIQELGYNHVDVDPVEASSYTAQTVDFPDSPHQLKLLQQKSYETQGFNPEDDYDEDELRAALSPSSNQSDRQKGRPCTLDPLQQPIKRKILVTPDILRSKDDDQKSLSSLSNHSETDMLSPGVDDLMTPDDIDTPDELDESILERFGSIGSDTIPEMTAAEEYDAERSWRTCYIAGIERKIDLKVIEPYKKVLSHGGYYGENRNAIILFSACYLPDRSRRDYDYVMDNLFLYVLTTLDTLVAEDYILIYLHGATQRSNMPSFGWLKRCYQMIDRRLRKNLKQLFLVHPSFWVKTIVIMTKPFISSKFSRKLKFINNLQELSELIPMDDVCIPDKVKQFDETTKGLEETN